MSTTQVRTYLNEMKLPGMAVALEKTTADATADSWSYTEFLDVLLQAEQDSREKRRSQSRIKASKLKLHPAFEDFDFTASRSITKAQIKELYALKWVDRFSSSDKPGSARPLSRRRRVSRRARTEKMCSS